MHGITFTKTQIYIYGIKRVLKNEKVKVTLGVRSFKNEDSAVDQALKNRKRRGLIRWIKACH